MIINDECKNAMTKMESNSIDFIVTDPPYGLNFMGNKWDSKTPNIDIWQEALRICKPGSMLAAFGGSRTHHHLMMALENAGWEIRDCIFWCFGSGFPKSHNFGCKCEGDTVPYNHVQRQSKSNSCLHDLPEVIQETTLLGEKNEESLLQSILQRQGKKQASDQIQQQWKGGDTTRNGDENGKESCLEGGDNLQEEQGKLYRPKICEMSRGIQENGQERWLCDGTSSCNGQTYKENITEDRSGSSQGSQHKEQLNRESGTISEQSNPQAHGVGTCEKCGGLIGWNGFGTALKPAYEPIILAMKPLEGTYAQNAQKWGVAGININDCRIPHNETCKMMKKQDVVNSMIQQSGRYKDVLELKPEGRWPANLILDEEAAKKLDEMTEVASRFFYCAKASSKERNAGLEGMPLKECHRYGAGIGEGIDPRAPAKDKNIHPTVKPLSLMKYLLTLLAPPGNPTCLDPFAGSGSTLVAAKELGIKCIGIELSEEYCNIANARVSHAAI